ncbi:MAG TPA: hypothetical protein VGH87_18480 [Polyangiaceae bacterium]
MRRLIVLVAFLACDDKATPDYTKCVDLETKGQHAEARAACSAAANVDPRSKDGVAAATKMAEIDSKVREENAKIVAAAASNAATETKSKEELEELRCKGKKWATKCMTGHRPDGTEKWTGMQWFDTRDACKKVTSGVGTCDECACM